MGIGEDNKKLTMANELYTPVDLSHSVIPDFFVYPKVVHVHKARLQMLKYDVGTQTH